MRASLVILAGTIVAMVVSAIAGYPTLPFLLAGSALGQLIALLPKLVAKAREN